jgi:hypothetical protein
MGIVFGAWLASDESATIRQSRPVKLGQSLSEVEAIMGQSHTSVGYGDGEFRITYSSEMEQARIRIRKSLNTWLRKAGLRSMITHVHDPVEIYFRGHRVDFIRRGDEVINRWGVVFEQSTPTFY